MLHGFLCRWRREGLERPFCFQQWTALPLGRPRYTGGTNCVVGAGGTRSEGFAPTVSATSPAVDLPAQTRRERHPSQATGRERWQSFKAPAGKSAVTTLRWPLPPHWKEREREEEFNAPYPTGTALLVPVWPVPTLALLSPPVKKKKKKKEKKKKGDSLGSGSTAGARQRY